MSQEVPGIACRFPYPITVQHHHQKTSVRAWWPHTCSQPKNICLEFFSKSSQAVINSAWNLFFLPFDNQKSVLKSKCVFINLKLSLELPVINPGYKRPFFLARFMRTLKESCALRCQIGKCYWRAISYYIWHGRWENSPRPGNGQTWTHMKKEGGQEGGEREENLPQW